MTEPHALRRWLWATFISLLVVSAEEKKPHAFYPDPYVSFKIEQP